MVNETKFLFYIVLVKIQFSYKLLWFKVYIMHGNGMVINLKKEKEKKVASSIPAGIRKWF